MRVETIVVRREVLVRRGDCFKVLRRKRLVRLVLKIEMKCEKNMAQLAHKKNVVATKRVTITLFVCHFAHTPRELAQQPGVRGRESEVRKSNSIQNTWHTWHTTRKH